MPCFCRARATRYSTPLLNLRSLRRLAAVAVPFVTAYGQRSCRSLRLRTFARSDKRRPCTSERLLKYSLPYRWPEETTMCPRKTRVAQTQRPEVLDNSPLQYAPENELEFVVLVHLIFRSPAGFQVHGEG